MRGVIRARGIWINSRHKTQAVACPEFAQMLMGGCPIILHADSTAEVHPAGDLECW